MQTFKNPKDGSIWEFDDDVIDVFAFPSTPRNLVPCTRPKVDKSKAEHALTVQQAQAALDKSDITVLRCFESDVTVPAAWREYRTALRDIIGSTSFGVITELPALPPYPSGT